MPAPRIRAVAVVVPVRNEEALLERCVRGIDEAIARLTDRAGPGVRAVTVLVLDGCDDGSSEIARRSGARVLELDAANVGLARAAGVRLALGELRGQRGQRGLSRLARRARLERIPPRAIWLAHTDADSQVPADWLAGQLALAEQGWDVVLGRVQPDLADLPEALHHTPAAMAAVDGEPVYGANLGVRASAYLAAGGFRAATEHEDQHLVAALRRQGARVTASSATPVFTSGRVAGRTPGGYAGFLRNALAGAG